MKKRNISLDILRVLAISSVILLHVLFIFRNKYYLTNNSYFILFTFFDAFTRVGVPIFFMLTGILLLNKKEEHTSFIKQRIPKLLISYIVFSIIYIIYDVITGSKIVSIKDTIQIILSKQAAYHLWYMPVIILIYLLIPFIQKIISHFTKEDLNKLIGTIFLLGNITLSVSVITTRLGRPLLDNFYYPNLIIYMNYLFIGYYLYKYKPKMSIRITILALISIILIPFLTYFISNKQMIDFFLNVLSPFVVFISTFVVLKEFNKERKISKKLTNVLESISHVSLYMYLIHVLIISITTNIFQKQIQEATLIQDLCWVIAIFVITWVLSYILSMMIDKIIQWIKKNRDKMKNWFIKTSMIIFALMTFYCAISLMLNSYHFTTFRYPLLFLSILIIVGLFYGIYKIQNKLFHNRVINIILLILYVIFQLMIIYCYAVRPTWDFGTVYYLARDVASNTEKFNTIYYLYICDNNIPLAALFSLLFKPLFLLKLEKFTGVLALGINLLAIDVSQFFLFKTIRKINQKLSITFLFFCLFFSPLVFYLPIFYSDTLSLPFVCIPLYYYYKYTVEEKKKSYLFLMGFLLGIGILLKATVGILVIAIILGAILLKNMNWKQLGTVLLFVLIPVCLTKIWIKLSFSEEEMIRSRKPMTHFVMMGLKNNGGFNEEDMQFTTKIPNYEKKKKKTIEKIKERLYNYYRDHQILHFYNKKLNYTWADGTFFADKALGMEYYHPKYQKYIQSSSKESWIYFNMANAEWFILLLLMLLGTVFRKHLSNTEKMIQFVVNISIFGVFLFLIIWETRSRYLVNFSPLFLISGYLGLISIINCFKKKLGEKK